MNRTGRREFLADVGRAMLLAGVGSQLAGDLGLARASADEETPPLKFGALEPMVAMMQDLPPERLLPLLVEQIKAGTSLDRLLAAGALANARTFGGEDYIGFHTFMALVPAGEMARELPEELAPLPVLKVLYRNTARIQAFGGREAEVLHPVAVDPSAGVPDGVALREATRKGDFEAAERTFAAMMQGGMNEAYNQLQLPVQDEENVHRVVLAWRAWSTLDLTGKEHAHTLLRQTVRFCCETEADRKNRPPAAIRELLPKLLDQNGLLKKPLGERLADDEWIEKFSKTVFASTKEQAAEAAAMALAEGISPESIGEAISLAATELLLRDPGRPERYASPEKPVGSVHGDSFGVHASDAANAWRGIASVSNHRNTVASLIVAASHTAGQSGYVGSDPFELKANVGELADLDGDGLLREAETAIKASDQSRTGAIVRAYGERQLPYRPLFDLLLRHSVSEDGALHAEKYYRTVTEEFARTRPAFRWRHVTALGRVIASEYGRPAPGYSEARELLSIKKA